MQTLLLTLDLVGTFVFALSGAIAGVKRRLDLFGVLVLSFAAGNAGGITRDVLIGATPPGLSAIGATSPSRYLLRVPGQDGHDSDAMADSIPRR